MWHSRTIEGNERRDFRLVTCPNGCPNPGKPSIHPVIWYEKDVESTDSNGLIYEATLEAPEYGWNGFFLEADFEGIGLSTYKFSTELSVIP